jgi:RNA polymerase sigma-70 factor, ECF subfamily
VSELSEVQLTQSGPTETGLTEDGRAEVDLASARAGDAAAFTRLVAPLRRQLHAHC